MNAHAHAQAQSSKLKLTLPPYRGREYVRRSSCNLHKFVQEFVQTGPLGKGEVTDGR